MKQDIIQTWERRFLYLKETVLLLAFLYCFLLSIELLGNSLRGAGNGILHTLDMATNNPYIGLIVGIVVTSIIQSSSTTTSIVVTMVGTGTLNLDNAIPIVIGANIGTTVTNTLVSFGYIGRKLEFERAFGASIVHDMFNIYATIILFPLEIRFHILRHAAVQLVKLFRNAGGFTIISPLKLILSPVSDFVAGHTNNHIVLMIIAIVLLFISLAKIVENTQSIVIKHIDIVLNKYFFVNAATSLLVGLLLTALIQSSSITTSLIIPLVGTGILTIEQIFPYTLGANVGTTVTAILAALSFGTESALTIAFCHLLFNVFGIVILFPLKMLPILTAKHIASYASQSNKHFLLFVIIYIILHTVPIIIVFIN